MVNFSCRFPENALCAAIGTGDVPAGFVDIMGIPLYNCDGAGNCIPRRPIHIQ